VPSAHFHPLLRIPERARLPIRGIFECKRGHPRVVRSVRGRLDGNPAILRNAIRSLRVSGPISRGRQVGGTKRRVSREETTLARVR
jgi:hypothetical protein